MKEETYPTKVYKMVLLFVDHDDLGPEGAADLIENARYPNHIVGPTVMSTEERVVEWNDDHPLNQVSSVRTAAFEKLFGHERLFREVSPGVFQAVRSHSIFSAEEE